jgi:N-acetylmuramoyl-L-alanine amidase
LSSISRSTARTFSLAVALVFALIGATLARADAATTFVFDGKPLPISHVATVGGKLAISVRDAGLQQLLRDVGASLTWNPGERYVLFTSAEPQIVSFAVGDTRYDVGPRSAQASFAPYEQSGTVYVPFNELMNALYLAPKRDGDAIVIQPQLATFDVRGGGMGSTIEARAGIPLRPRVVSQSASQLVYAFDGVGTSLDRSPTIRGAGIRSIAFVQSGTTRDPVTTVTIDLTPGTTHGTLQGDDRNGVTLAIGGGSAPPEPVAAETDAPAPGPTDAAATQNSPAPSVGGATVTGLDAHAGPNGYTVDIAVGGNATYEWHRLGASDPRFWIDFHNTTLAQVLADITGSDPVTSVRVRQHDGATVRVALSLTGLKRLDVQPSADGVKVSVYTDDAGADVAFSGSGTVGNAAAVAVVPSPVPSGSDWKFGARSTYVATNPRLIAIDPGHGGSDPGSTRGSVHEASLTLDMAKRLRDVLIARGWQVVMIRTTDIDVYKPNDTAHEELQARDDIANNAGARMLISIHVNSWINSGPNGTTSYYSKPIDVALAKAVQASAAAQLGTTDDGIVKSHLFITLHAKMPAVLVETAFLSNPDDWAKLSSPDWRQKLAVSIADGVKNYAGDPPAPSQSANQ